MAVNRRFMVVGKWYGQRWADADFEVWDSRERAERSLWIRDNMRLDRQRILGDVPHYGGDWMHISRLEYTSFYADSLEACYIDVYGHEMEYSHPTLSWVFRVGEPLYRLSYGPRGGIVRESF